MRYDCGRPPVDMGPVHVPITEMMFYLYLPVKFPEHEFIDPAFIPQRLKPLTSILGMIPVGDWEDRYVYITAKRTHVSPGNMSNRPGWHCDGYGTDDLNFIWSDCVPTEYSVGDFQLSHDDWLSMQEMEQQAPSNSILRMPNRHLIRIDDRVVHRVAEGHNYTGLRTFVKISISRFKYNLVGNSHNHLIDYNWTMYDRNAMRNMEHNGDFVREDA